MSEVGETVAAEVVVKPEPPPEPRPVLNVERLEYQIKILEGVIASNAAFNLATWMVGDNADPEFSIGDVKATCGTTCCAFGYGALDPVFQAQGLEMTVTGFKRSNQEYADAVGIVKSIAEFNAFAKTHTDLGGVVKFTDDESFCVLYGFDAAASFFGFTKDIAMEVFWMGDYHAEFGKITITPAHVIARIRKVIETDGEHSWDKPVPVVEVAVPVAETVAPA